MNIPAVKPAALVLALLASGATGVYHQLTLSKLSDRADAQGKTLETLAHTTGTLAAATRDVSVASGRNTDHLGQVAEGAVTANLVVASQGAAMHALGAAITDVRGDLGALTTKHELGMETMNNHQLALSTRLDAAEDLLGALPGIAANVAAVTDAVKDLKDRPAPADPAVLDRLAADAAEKDALRGALQDLQVANADLTADYQLLRTSTLDSGATVISEALARAVTTRLATDARMDEVFTDLREPMESALTQWVDDMADAPAGARPEDWALEIGVVGPGGGGVTLLELRGGKRVVASWSGNPAGAGLQRLLDVRPPLPTGGGLQLRGLDLPDAALDELPDGPPKLNVD